LSRRRFARRLHGVLEKQESGSLAHLVDLDDAALSSPEARANAATAGDVLVRIDWSTLNYKDGLAVTGRAPIVRTWPMVAGIDGAGTVIESTHPDWKAGDAVVLNGWGVGETHEGLMRPVPGWETSGYGMRRPPILGYSRMHRGIDFHAPYGSPIYAVTDGVVEFAGRAHLRHRQARANAAHDDPPRWRAGTPRDRQHSAVRPERSAASGG